MNNLNKITDLLEYADANYSISEGVFDYTVEDIKSGYVLTVSYKDESERMLFDSLDELRLLFEKCGRMQMIVDFNLRDVDLNDQ